MKSPLAALLMGLCALVLLAAPAAWALPASAVSQSLNALVAATPLQPVKNDQGEEMKPPFQSQEQAQCVSKCQEPMGRCINQCKKGDHGCPARCAEKMVSCNRGCGMKVLSPKDAKNAQNVRRKGSGH
ncbi:hypothetical protein [Corallococcus aberystwythensis]|uniref:Uncharacterized protein n=1 Tax=Corallococcus aberystwythensis TaxID=2316722 RepID=A0A3A8QP54_9BACT|nr:hypothetical protein [Corallococcus aberystwythensis]RKH70526.1 hypothetical protein D7W81_09205 [Corallococcus aberystwythensis]